MDNNKPADPKPMNISYSGYGQHLISIELNEINLTEDDLVLYGRPFSDSYKAWIADWVDEHAPGAFITINGSMRENEPFSISVKASDTKQLAKISMFIGYAFGQQDNGR